MSKIKLVASNHKFHELAIPKLKLKRMNQEWFYVISPIHPHIPLNFMHG